MDEINLPIKHESKPYLMIPLPDGATNGDVIKALFPHIIVREDFDLEGFVEADGLDKCTTFYTEWWNAPYKRGD